MPCSTSAVAALCYKVLQGDVMPCSTPRALVTQAVGSLLGTNTSRGSLGPRPATQPCYGGLVNQLVISDVSLTSRGEAG
jgi:hypothetical protein